MKVEWPTAALIVACYGLWLLAGIYVWPVVPVIALAIMAVMAALHSSLVHECLHGHPTRKRLVNEALVTLPLSLVYPYRRYKATHLAHHHDEMLTDPIEDPESYYRAQWQFQAMPKGLRVLLGLNNSLVGRMILGPWLGAIGFFVSEARAFRDNARGVRLAWALHLPAVGVVLLIVSMMQIPLWVYVLCVVWPSMSLISLRTFAEHRWHDLPAGRTIIVERSPLAWLYLFNNLHIVHHTHPSLPWYKIPGEYARQREHWQRVNQGYVFPNYWALFRAWALTPKEPVAHPVLHRER